MEWTIPAFAFPSEAGTHLPTPEGWKAELALGGWLVTYRNKCPAPVGEWDKNSLWRLQQRAIFEAGQMWKNM